MPFGKGKCVAGEKSLRVFSCVSGAFWHVNLKLEPRETIRFALSCRGCPQNHPTRAAAEMRRAWPRRPERFPRGRILREGFPLRSTETRKVAFACLVQSSCEATLVTSRNGIRFCRLKGKIPDLWIHGHFRGAERGRISGKVWLGFPRLRRSSA